jgi:uncharacterized protein YpiB (UPF0302 family)
MSMERMDSNYSVMLGLVAEMIWDEAIRKYREERLHRGIDHALAQGDETTFLALTNELKQLNSYEAMK